MKRALAVQPHQVFNDRFRYRLSGLFVTAKNITLNPPRAPRSRAEQMNGRGHRAALWTHTAQWPPKFSSGDVSNAIIFVVQSQ